MAIEIGKGVETCVLTSRAQNKHFALDSAHLAEISGSIASLSVDFSDVFFVKWMR